MTQQTERVIQQILTLKIGSKITLDLAEEVIGASSAFGLDMKKQDLINTLISGVIILKIGREYIFINPPSAEDKTFADFFSYEIYEDCLLDGMLKEEEVEEFLIENGFWSKEESELMEQIQKNMQQMKLDYFNSFYNSTTKEYIQKNLEKQEKRVSELYKKKSLFSDKTCEYVADYARKAKYLENNAFQKNGRLATDLFSFNKIINKFYSRYWDINARLREVAKSPEWRNIWFGVKEKLFQNNPSSFTDLQHNIISWSYYYDNINESMDRPSEEIIQDDIALDGWGEKQKRKRQEEEKKKQAEDMLPDNIGDAGEVFIPVRNQKEAQDVHNLNNPQGKAKLRSLKRDLDKHGSVNESDLSSTRRELQMQSNQMASQNRRR